MGRGCAFTSNTIQNGPVALALRDALLGIQRGTAADTLGWLHQVALA
jgi:branched-chain amino acid aminotransferase